MSYTYTAWIKNPPSSPIHPVHKLHSTYFNMNPELKDFVAGCRVDACIVSMVGLKLNLSHSVTWVCISSISFMASLMAFGVVRSMMKILSTARIISSSASLKACSLYGIVSNFEENELTGKQLLQTTFFCH